MTKNPGYGIEATLNAQRAHHLFVAALYLLAIGTSISVLNLPEARKDAVTLISSGAVVATFGSALAGLGAIWERDLLERVRLNVDILYKDILKQNEQWRRWPFLPRAGFRRMLDGSSQSWKLQNPEIPLNVGTHVVKVQVPTVLEDFFDLPLLQNFATLKKFRTAAATTYSTRRMAEKDEEGPATGSNEGKELMLYECLHDTWQCIVIFRVARYIEHLGAALAISAAVLTIANVAWH